MPSKHLLPYINFKGCCLNFELTAKENSVVHTRLQEGVDRKEPDVKCNWTKRQSAGSHKTTKPRDELFVSHKSTKTLRHVIVFVMKFSMYLCTCQRKLQETEPKLLQSLRSNWRSSTLLQWRSIEREDPGISLDSNSTALPTRDVINVTGSIDLYKVFSPSLSW